MMTFDSLSEITFSKADMCKLLGKALRSNVLNTYSTEEVIVTDIDKLTSGRYKISWHIEEDKE